MLNYIDLRVICKKQDLCQAIMGILFSALTLTQVVQHVVSFNN